MGERIQHLVVGSGLNGFAAALALVTAGRPVSILDFGGSPRSSSFGFRSPASKSNPQSHSALSYPKTLIAPTQASPLSVSSARGGLSLIWGAAVLQRDSSDCPELTEVFEGISAGFDLLRQHVPLAGDDDQLTRRFPWPSGLPSVPASTRFSEIRSEALHGGAASDGVLAGGPRVAMRSDGCIRCGLCLVGCPERLFFDAVQGLERLESGGLVRYLRGPALRLSPRGQFVGVETPHGSIEAEQVHLAAGPIATPALLQRSGLIPDVIAVQDSAVFYVPVLNRRRSFGDESDYTAAQLLLAAAKNGPDDFTLAIYESNPDFRDRLAQILRIPAHLIPFPNSIQTRINAGIGFLSPERSGDLVLRHKDGRTWVTPRARDGVRTAALAAIGRAARRTAPLGLRPIAPAVIVPPPGAGFHSGGSLPVGGEHVAWDGRLRALPAVSIVDASALPRIWPGSHTFTAMANAIRSIRAAG